MDDDIHAVADHFLCLLASDNAVSEVRYSAYAGASIEATRTNFLFTNSWMPKLESSRP
jgi:hypothetical protein